MGAGHQLPYHEVPGETVLPVTAEEVSPPCEDDELLHCHHHILLNSLVCSHRQGQGQTPA